MKNNTFSAYKIIMLIGVLAIFSCGEFKEKKQARGTGNHPAIEDIFNELDTNTDSLLSKDEVRGPLERDFNTLDLDKDGFISKEELENAPKPQRQERHDSK